MFTRQPLHIFQITNTAWKKITAAIQSLDPAVQVDTHIQAPNMFFANIKSLKNADFIKLEVVSESYYQRQSHCFLIIKLYSWQEN